MPLLRFQPASSLADISDELGHCISKNNFNFMIFCDAGTVVVGTYVHLLKFMNQMF